MIFLLSMYNFLLISYSPLSSLLLTTNFRLVYSQTTRMYIEIITEVYKISCDIIDQDILKR